MAHIRAYVDSLQEKYDVHPDYALVATLDYASTDPEVTARLKEDDRPVVTLPWREITVNAPNRSPSRGAIP